MLEHYELTYIVPVKFIDDELKKVSDEVNALIKKFNGQITEDYILGRQKLAYPIKKEHQGTYMVVEFDMETEDLKKLNTQLDLMNEVLRHLIVRKRVKTEEEIKKEQAIQEKLRKQKEKELDEERQEEKESVKNQSSVTKKEEPKVSEEKKETEEEKENKESKEEEKKRKEMKEEKGREKIKKETKENKEEKQGSDEVMEDLDDKLDKILADDIL